MNRLNMSIFRKWKPDTLNLYSLNHRLLSKFGLILVIICLGGMPHLSGAEVKPKKSDSYIALISPANHHRLLTSTVMFRWTLDDMDSSGFKTEYYEVVFWSKYQTFSFMRTIYPEKMREGILRLTDIQDHFRKHGRYYWQVQAVAEDGRRVVSEIRELVLPIPRNMQFMMPAWFPYAIKWQRIQRLNNRKFGQLMNDVYPKTHLQGYTDLSLIFRQPQIAQLNVDLEEQLMVNSSIGLGGEFELRWRIYENTYVGFHPTGCMNVCWYATGLERYSSTRFQTNIGLDFIINPKGYVSSYTRWIPMYRFHYSVKNDGFRIFEGNGWEWGVRVYVPRSIMNPFHIFGLEMDMERMPIEYTYSRIKDDYTGVIMSTQEISISFLFQ